MKTTYGLVDWCFESRKGQKISLRPPVRTGSGFVSIARDFATGLNPTDLDPDRCGWLRYLFLDRTGRTEFFISVSFSKYGLF